MIIEGNSEERDLAEAGVPQGLHWSPIPFAIYTSGLIKWVEEYVPAGKGLSFVDNLGWVVTGSDVNQVVMIHERCAAKRIEWAGRRGLQFDTTKTDAALFTHSQGHKKHLRPKLTAKLWVSEGFIQFNRQATCWLGIWMDMHLMVNEHHNRFMKKARAAKGRLRTLTQTYRVVPESVMAIQVACVQAVALYASDLWWDPSQSRRRHDLQLLLNQPARSFLGALPKTPRRAQMRDSGLTPTAVLFEPRQQHSAARLANACSNKLRELHQNPSSGTPVCRAVMKELKHGQMTEGMSLLAPGKESVVRTVILDDATAANRAAQLWAREQEAKLGAGVWIWWTGGSRSDDGRVKAAAICKHREEWRSRCTYLGTGQTEVCDGTMLAIRLGLEVTMEMRETPQ